MAPDDHKSEILSPGTKSFDFHRGVAAGGGSSRWSAVIDIFLKPDQTVLQKDVR